MTEARATHGRSTGVIVRAPNHLGDVVMALGALREAGRAMRDAEVIAAADDRGMAMVFTGSRHFKH